MSMEMEMKMAWAILVTCCKPKNTTKRKVRETNMKLSRKKREGKKNLKIYAMPFYARGLLAFFFCRLMLSAKLSLIKIA